MKIRVFVPTMALAAGLATVSSAVLAARPLPPSVPDPCSGSVSVACGGTFPQYAVTEFGSSLLGGDVTLTESGSVQYAVFDGYPRQKLFEWTPSTGLQQVGVRDNLRTEQTPYGLVTVLDANSTGGWVGKTGNPSISNVMVVGGSASEAVLVPTSTSTGTLSSMYAYDMSDQRTVVGYGRLPDNYYEGEVTTYYDPAEEGITTYLSRYGSAPFVWTAEGGTKIIPSLLETYGNIGSQIIATADTLSAAYAVNNQGQVVGADALRLEYSTPSYAFIWSEAQGIRSLGRMAGHNASIASDINDAGVVVGRSGVTVISSSYWDVSKGFIWTEAGGMLDLDALITDADKARGVNIKGASAVNESGQILAVALGGGDLRYVLLTPVPEPGTASLMALGALGVLWVARRVRASKQAGLSTQA